MVIGRKQHSLFRIKFYDITQVLIDFLSASFFKIFNYRNHIIKACNNNNMIRLKSDGDTH